MKEEKTRVPNRYRLIGPDGKCYAPFRVKPGVLLMQILPKGDGWELETA
jgi:hypothetical protein